jgi:aspartyl aminopeptidase
MTKEETITLYQNMIRQYERNNDDLIARYGTGVRPSWISEDLAINGHHIMRYKKKIAELEAQTDA